MRSPIYFQQAMTSPAVVAAEAAIVAQEGRHHVAGAYYASEADAAQQRRWEAERRVRAVDTREARKRARAIDDAVSPLVREAEWNIRCEEGAFHVGGTHYANASEASQQRRLLAEKRVRAALRQAARLPKCGYCFHALLPTEDTVEFAGKELHRGCARDFDEWANGPTSAEVDEALIEIDYINKEAA